MTPAIPLSVDLVREVTVRPTTEWLEFPWHAQLQWIAGCRGLTAQQVDFLHRVHVGLVHGKFAEAAPLKYRSLQLTGDEKRLATLMNTSLFGSNRLTLALLGCLPDTLPMAWEAVGKGSRMLVFENAGPFAVARSVLSEMNDPPFGLIGYGGGMSIVAALGHLSTIEPRPSAILYVGDIDLPGMNIANAARARASYLGLPPIEPATCLHRAMLKAAAAFGFATGWPASTLPKASPSERLRLTEFLAKDLRGAVESVLAAGRRIPEEVVGPIEFRTAIYDEPPDV